MKKVLLIAAILLTAMGCSRSQTITTPVDSNGSPEAKTQTYQNQSLGFTFKYPVELKETNFPYNNLTNKVIQVGLNKDTYPKTNFNDAAFTVSYQTAKDLAQCLAFVRNESGTFKNTEVINGKTFYTLSGTGAGAGNLYEDRTYRTFKDGECFELMETIHTSNIGNYPAGTVTEINKNPIWDKLDQTLKSFQFN